ncbi:MAG: hypothetical protein LBH25_09810 [Fibromonadaceae bacterium]|jgi:hypothetical protein|nr:hypothetical protein [Fibromonadaceae bacterium]
MFSRLTLLLVAFVLVFLTACPSPKGGGSRSGGGGGYDGYEEGEEPPPRADQLKEARNEAFSLTEENHKMSREIFELKNKLGMPTD